MGLFSFVGKAVKGIAHVVGGVAKVGLKAASLGGALGILPGGGLLGRLGSILAHKQPMSGTPLKVAQIGRLGVSLMRGAQPPPRSITPHITAYRGKVPAAVLRASPVMPGGAVAHPRGIAPKTHSPPATYGGVVSAAAGGGRKRKRRRSSSSTTHRRRKRGTSHRRRGRKLKFGSPAWRKKYLGHGRRKRRRAA